MSKVKSFSAKSSLVGVVLSAAALIGFTVYGMVYDYFDTVVFLTLALGMVGMAAYALVDRAWSELLNLAASPLAWACSFSTAILSGLTG